MRKQRRTLRGEDLREAVRFRRAGLKLAAIAAHFDVSVSQVSVAINRYENQKKREAVKRVSQAAAGVSMTVSPDVTGPSLAELCKPISAKAQASISGSAWRDMSMSNLGRGE